MQTLKTKSLAWHHLERATPEELEWLWENFHFNPLVMDELTRPTVRPKADFYETYLYLVLHFPVPVAGSPEPHLLELDCILTHKALITVTYEPTEQINGFFKKCSLEASCADIYASKTPAHLFSYILKEFYAASLKDLDQIEEALNGIEDRFFTADEREVIAELSRMRHEITDFRRALKPHQATLESLSTQGRELYGASIRHIFDSLVGDYLKVWNLLENNKEAVDALYDNNVTILNIKQNEAMRVLSIMAFVTFPLMLVAALFSMNTVATPILGYRHDFWVILAMMVAGSLLMFTYFKRKHWL